MKRLGYVLAACLMVALTVGNASEPRAEAAGSFTFFGGGFGHGIGMSQYGALGMAQDGRGYKEILTQFFTDTSVGPHALPDYIRVGLVQGQKIFHVRARFGKVELRVGDPKGALAGTIPGTQRWEIRTGSGHYRILDEQGKLVGGREWGGPQRDLFAVYEQNGAAAQIQESNGITYNHGVVEFNIYGDTHRGRLIAILAPQAYLYGLGEVPSEWPMAALQAQAVAARTYAFEIVTRAGQHQSWCNCAVTDDTRNQVYIGYAKEGGPAGDRWVAAVDHTDGEVVLWHGDLIQAQYASSSGGYTEDNENVWTGSPLPYLRGVCDPGDYTPDNPNRVWRRQFTAAEVTSRLSSYIGSIGTVTNFTNIRRGVSGRIITADVVGTSGRDTVTGSELRWGLGLLDDRVWINSNRTVTGAIRNKYDGLNCRPKLPQSPQTGVAGGRQQRFANGTIFYSDAAGPHWLRDAVLAKFRELGGPAGKLGFPTSDVQTGDDGRTWADFQHGRIVCPAGGGDCFEA
jgi:stage II sporulation protein D